MTRGVQVQKVVFQVSHSHDHFQSLRASAVFALHHVGIETVVCCLVGVIRRYPPKLNGRIVVMQQGVQAQVL